jgi:hypothetical protein
MAEPQVKLVHVYDRDKNSHQWYEVDAKGNIITVICISLAQLRIALALQCLALQEPPVEIVR